MNPYDVLDVPRDASAERIKAAYRRKVKLGHPDVGGSSERFQSLNYAWKILSDPMRRKHYDQTGKVDEIEPDNDRAKVLSVLIQTFNRVIEYGDSVFHRDLILNMRSVLKGDIGALDVKLSKISESKLFLEKLSGRFRNKNGGESLFDLIIASKIDELNRAFEGIQAIKSPTLKAIELLMEYEYQQDELVTILSMNISTSSSS